MNIAYLISAHTDAPQLRRLVDALHPDAQFFIHIDKKSDIEPFRRLLTRPNVHLLEHRINVRWGTINEWDYQLALLRAAIAHPMRFDRLVTLSGMDYPLWSNRHISDYFESKQGTELLAAMPLYEYLESKWIFRQVRPYLTLPLIGNRGNQRIGILLRKLIGITGYRRNYSFTVGGHEWREYKGSAWWAISEDLARFVVSTYDAHTREIRDQFRHQHCPAETLLPTIAFNSPQWREHLVAFPCEDWVTLKEMTLLHHIEYTTAIRIWKAADYPLLVRSGRMFTRKLTSKDSLELVALIDDSRK